jgi:hypothetical protein
MPNGRNGCGKRARGAKWPRNSYITPERGVIMGLKPYGNGGLIIVKVAWEYQRRWGRVVLKL